LIGPANIFFNGDFVATSELKTAVGSNELEFLLGADPSISVNYAPIKTFSEAKGLMKKSKQIQVEHKTTISNSKNVNISIIVSDELPLSLEEQIKVKVLEPEDLKKANAKVTDQNIIQWEVEVKALGSIQIPFRYSVEWPTDKPLYGLETDDN